MLGKLNDIVKNIKMVPLCVSLAVFAIAVGVFFMWKTGKLNIPLMEGFDGKSEDELKSLEAERDLVVFFNMKGCPHCEKFKPEWDKLSEKINNNADLAHFKLIMVSSEVASNSAHIKDSNNYPTIKGYPTIMIKKRGKKAVEYTGDREAGALETFIKEQK